MSDDNAERTSEKPAFDRAVEDVGNILQLEHVNLTVPDQGIAALFYVTGLGFTRDPYIDFGTFNMWVNLGEQQFHLPKADAQLFRGHVKVVVPSLEDLKKRLKFIAKPMSGSKFDWREADDHIALTCPWGNDIRAYEPGVCRRYGARHAGSLRRCARGHQRRHLPFLSAGDELPGEPRGHRGKSQSRLQPAPGVLGTSEVSGYDGHHIAVYVADFSGPHRWLAERQLITEESDQHQYRFQAIVDPDTGETLTELEHEVRSLAHAMFHRPLVNRNPAVNFFTYQKGNEIFTPGSHT